MFWGRVSCVHRKCLYRGPSALAWLVLAQVFEGAGGSAPSTHRSRALHSSVLGVRAELTAASSRTALVPKERVPKPV